MGSIGFEEAYPLFALSTTDVGGLGWGTEQIGKVKWRALANKFDAWRRGDVTAVVVGVVLFENGLWTRMMSRREWIKQRARTFMGVLCQLHFFPRTYRLAFLHQV